MVAGLLVEGSGASVELDDVVVHSNVAEDATGAAVSVPGVPCHRTP
ncbi:MAG: hypothetical protein AAGA48_25020 [Myxococcota bacterium]